MKIYIFWSDLNAVSAKKEALAMSHVIHTDGKRYMKTRSSTDMLYEIRKYMYTKIHAKQTT